MHFPVNDSFIPLPCQGLLLLWTCKSIAHKYISPINLFYYVIPMVDSILDLLHKLCNRSHFLDAIYQMLLRNKVHMSTASMPCLVTFILLLRCVLHKHKKVAIGSTALLHRLRAPGSATISTIAGDTVFHNWIDSEKALVNGRDGTLSHLCYLPQKKNQQQKQEKKTKNKETTKNIRQLVDYGSC